MNKNWFYKKYPDTGTYYWSLQLINRMCNVIRTCTGKALIPSVLAVFVTWVCMGEKEHTESPPSSRRLHIKQVDRLICYLIDWLLTVWRYMVRSPEAEYLVTTKWDLTTGTKSYVLTKA